MEKEKNNSIENMKKLVGACPTCNRRPVDLPIGRVPDNTLVLFKELANKEFKGDYGFTLKHILDFYVGLIPTGWEHLEIEINILKEKIENMEEKKSDEKKGRLMADGKRKDI